ncbi:MAG: heliorhodopsin HeR [Gaiellales bacterium]
MIDRTSAEEQPPTASGVNGPRLRDLRRWNVGLALLHAAQAVAILVLAGDFAITVTSQFPRGAPGSRAPAPDALFDVRIGAAIAVFLGLAAIDHLLTATRFRARYERELAAGVNRFRWIEYSVSATLMVVLIGFYCGITEITAIVAIAGANIAMILFGWIQEVSNPPGRASTTMRPFWFGTIAGAAPWVAIIINLIGAGSSVPGFVYGIFVSLFVLFMSFALNQWLQYKEIGPWKSYAFGEKTYLVLSLIAKSALAWQIFSGSLSS